MDISEWNTDTDQRFASIASVFNIIKIYIIWILSILKNHFFNLLFSLLRISPSTPFTRTKFEWTEMKSIIEKIINEFMFPLHSFTNIYQIQMGILVFAHRFRRTPDNSYKFNFFTQNLYVYNTKDCFHFHFIVNNKKYKQKLLHKISCKDGPVLLSRWTRLLCYFFVNSMKKNISARTQTKKFYNTRALLLKTL